LTRALTGFLVFDLVDWLRDCTSLTTVGFVNLLARFPFRENRQNRLRFICYQAHVTRADGAPAADTTPQKTAEQIKQLNSRLSMIGNVTLDRNFFKLTRSTVSLISSYRRCLAELHELLPAFSSTKSPHGPKHRIWHRASTRAALAFF
jgi:hypothetical protein